METIIEKFNPDTVFSLAFLLIVIGSGTWFTRQFWPWYSKYKDREHKINERLASEIAGLRSELGLFLHDLGILIDLLKQNGL